MMLVCVYVVLSKTVVVSDRRLDSLNPGVKVMMINCDCPGECNVEKDAGVGV